MQLRRGTSRLFNFTTNGNGPLMRENFEGRVDVPAKPGMMLAVYSLGPVVKTADFESLLLAKALIACSTAFIVAWLPNESEVAAAPGSA